jgi:hypothetical protein
MENETRYCPKCGTMITSGGSCSNCGWRGTPSPVEHSPTNTNSFLTETMSKAEGFRDFKILISIIGIIAGIIVIINGFIKNEMGDFTYFNLIAIGIGILIILKSLFFLLHSITSYQHMNFQYFLAKSFLEEKKASDENINETIKTFFEDSDSK